MCLTSKEGCPSTSYKEIPGYKVLVHEYDEWKTPFRGVRMNPVGEAVSKGEDVVISRMVPSCSSNLCRLLSNISSGYIHICISASYAEYIAISVGGKVFKVVIPPETEYFISEDGEEACAKKIVFVD